MDDSRLNDIEFEIRKASVDYDYNTSNPFFLKCQLCLLLLAYQKKIPKLK